MKSRIHHCWMTPCSCESKDGAKDAPLWMFWQKMCQLKGWRPPLGLVYSFGKSWIRHCHANYMHIDTRMHSSSMRTARLLPVSPGMHCLWEGVPGLGGCTWSRGAYLPRYSPPVDRITDACENITLPQLRCGR